MRKTVTKSFNGEKLAAKDYIDRIILLMKKMTPACPRAIYMYITIIFKIFSSKTAWPIKPKFYVEPPWDGGTKVYINGLGHMTKMAAMPIYGKNL